MNIQIENVKITIVRDEDEYYIEAYTNDGIEDILVATFCIDAPLEGLDLLIAIKHNLKLLELIK